MPPPPPSFPCFCGVVVPYRHQAQVYVRSRVGRNCTLLNGIRRSASFPRDAVCLDGLVIEHYSNHCMFWGWGEGLEAWKRLSIFLSQ